MNIKGSNLQKLLNYFSIKPINGATTILLIILFKSNFLFAELPPNLEKLNQLKYNYTLCLKDKEKAQTSFLFSQNNLDSSNAVKQDFDSSCITQANELNQNIIKFLKSGSGEVVIKASILRNLNLLLNRNIKQIGPVNLVTLIEEINKLETEWFDGFSAFKPNGKNARTSGVCIPDERGFLISISSFFQMGYDISKLAGLVLHEILCSIPDFEEKSNFEPNGSFSEKATKRKYDDSNYQLSSVILVYSQLIEQNNERKIELFEKLWIKRNSTDSKIWLADGGSISGGPGGGSSHALWFKVHLLKDLFDKQWQCHQNGNNSLQFDLMVKWGENNFPCEWINSEWLQYTFSNLKIEEQYLESTKEMNAAITTEEKIAKIRYSKITHELPIKNSTQLLKIPFIEMGIVFMSERLYENEETREKIVNQLFSPCFKVTEDSYLSEKTQKCFFH